ncbi:ankyrin repeat domain-containing protein [Pyrobaculum aerophilum]|uniref:ankyrin repeat domain-containing protein n=1 Tax=Pyrobaculum aerophilum TaxID=13773 RepID=UPI002FD8A596
MDCNNLLNAARRGEAELLTRLLNEGCSPDVQDDYGRTPLYYAAERGDVGTVDLLIKAGADPNARDRGEDANYYCNSIAQIWSNSTPLCVCRWRRRGVVHRRAQRVPQGGEVYARPRS